ncbi:MAG: hypothetical protein RLZZ458_176 [Planctomycetota bacterium]
MNRKVLLTETASRQLQAATDWYALQSETVAASWFNGLIIGSTRLPILSLRVRTERTWSWKISWRKYRW